jgi:hypothetical protein
LKSGYYDQARNHLAFFDRKTQGWRFCVLGTACELYRELVGPLTVVRSAGVRLYNGNGQTLPLPVQEAFGFRNSLGRFTAPLGQRDYDSLQHANDSGLTFEEIVPLIEQHHQELFID